MDFSVTFKPVQVIINQKVDLHSNKLTEFENARINQAIRHFASISELKKQTTRGSIWCFRVATYRSEYLLGGTYKGFRRTMINLIKCE